MILNCRERNWLDKCVLDQKGHMVVSWSGKELAYDGENSIFTAGELRKPTIVS